MTRKHIYLGNQEKEVYEKCPAADLYLRYVDEISNVTVDATVIPDYYKWDNDQMKYISEGDVELGSSYISLSPKSTDCDFIARESINGSVINNEMSKVTNCNLTVQKKRDDFSEQINTINAVNSKLTAQDISNIAPNCEGSTFKGRVIRFTNRYVSGNSATVKNCKFEVLDKENYAQVAFPYQTKDRSSFNFGFDTCDFGKGFWFSVSYEGYKPWTDKDGKLITKAYFWYELNEDGSFKTDDWGSMIQKRSTDEKDIPAANKTNGKTNGDGYYDNDQNKWVTSNGYWIWENENGWSEDAFYKDYKGIITFEKTTLGGKAITKDTKFISSVSSGYDEKGEIATTTRFVLDGKSYKAVKDSDTQEWVLIEAE